MAEELEMVEDQRKGVGQETDHRQHHPRGRFVNCGVSEMTAGGDGLVDFRISGTINTFTFAWNE